MKFNEIIRKYRTSRGLTQEQVASYLGVSTPAVNKWEKGLTYPDVTLLPSLARLLGTDLNTLLCFKETLTEQEIGCFSNELVEIAEKEGISAAFKFASDKIHEYPNCDSLILTAALTLDGAVIFQNDKNDKEDYSHETEKLYERAALSNDARISGRAKSLLISKYMNRGDCEKAENLLGELPDEPPYDKKLLQSELCMMQGRLDEAAEIIEKKLLYNVTNEITNSLDTLIEIAIKQGRHEDAAHFANVWQNVTEIFDLWEFSSYIAHFQLVVAEQNANKCTEILKKMIPALLNEWNISSSSLYRHIPKKDGENHLGKMIFTKLISDLEYPNSAEYAFLRDSPEFQKFIEDVKSNYIL